MLTMQGAMPTPTDTMTHILDGIKAAGIFISGLWAAWTFHKLQKARKAEVDIRLQSSKAETELLVQREAEARLLAQQPQLGIDLAVAECTMPSKKKEKCLCVTVALVNEGSQNFKIEFDDPPLTVGLIVLGDNDEQEIQKARPFKHLYHDPSSDEMELPNYRIFRVGQKRQFDFLVPISEPGAYFVQFAAWYYRVGFRGEEPSDAEKEAEQILAYQQRIFLVS